MDTIKIDGSKRKILSSIFMSLFLGILALWGAVSPERFLSTMFNNALFIQITGALAALFLGLCFILFVKNFFTKKFNMIINEEGILDNSTYASVGMIYWKDIISVKQIGIMSTKFLKVTVKNPKKYINSKNKIKNMLLSINLKIYGTPIFISSNFLNIDFDKLEEIIINYPCYLGCKNRDKIKQ